MTLCSYIQRGDVVTYFVGGWWPRVRKGVVIAVPYPEFEYYLHLNKVLVKPLRGLWKRPRMMAKGDLLEVLPREVAELESMVAL